MGFITFLKYVLNTNLKMSDATFTILKMEK